MNRILKMLGVIALVALPAMAQTQEASTLVIDTPVQVGPKTLQPGVYTVRLLPTFAERMKVQFTSTDGKKIYASVLTVPHPLNAVKDEPPATFVFYKDAAGAPVALRTWYPAPSSAMGGHDIVYDEGHARQLARLAHTNVVSYTETTETANLDTTPLEVITPEETIQPYTPPSTGSMASAAPTPVETQTTTTQTTTTETTPAPAPMVSEAPVQTAEAQPMSMPHTASDLPLVALLGVAALGGAVALRAARQA